MSCFCYQIFSLFSFNKKLEGVSREVPLDGVLQRVGTLEELLALLLAQRSLAGVHVLVQELPELIGQVHHLQILGEPDSNIAVSPLSCVMGTN